MQVSLNSGLKICPRSCQQPRLRGANESGQRCDILVSSFNTFHFIQIDAQERLKYNSHIACLIPATGRWQPVERLQKVLANAGVASRRKCEELIRAGRVRVNEQIVSLLGTKVDPQHDLIEVDGQPISLRQSHVYLLVNKPPGYVSTASDPEGRPTVLDLVHSPARLYPVGRLDFTSEGLLLLTNDGELAQRLTHPSFEHEKEYLVWVDGVPTERALQHLREGIELEDGFTSPAKIKQLQSEKGGTWLNMIVHEGRKHQLRRMCEAIDHPVRRLIRVRMGPLTLGDLKPGQSRALTEQEKTLLIRSVGVI